MSYVLARRGTTGHVHVALEQRGVLVLACKGKAPADAHIWRSRRLIRAVWLADDTRRCLECSRRVSPTR